MNNNLWLIGPLEEDYNTTEKYDYADDDNGGLALIVVAGVGVAIYLVFVLLLGIILSRV